jgi:hypothetical protein
VQDQLQKLVASHAQHGSTLQTLGGIIGTGIGTYRSRAGAGPFAPVPTGSDVPPVSQVNPILKAVHENLVAEHNAHGAALKTLLSLVGVGPDFGPQTGTPDRPASIDDMNPMQLGDFHQDLSLYEADPRYPALSTVPAKVVDNGGPGVNPLGRSSRRMSNADQFKTDGHPIHGDAAGFGGDAA